MDISAVLGASWALSSEITVDGLHDRLLQMIVQTGARQAAVHTADAGTLCRGGTVSSSLEASLREVTQQGKPFAQDIDGTRLLCLPLLWQNSIQGALAAEYAPGVSISPDIQTLLHHVATQAAICLPQLRERERLQRAVQDTERNGQGGGFEARMISGFAHMIRNALTSTTFCFEAIRLTLDENANGAEETREALAAGKRGVDRALRVAGRISEFAHIGRGAQSVAPAGLSRGVQTAMFRASHRLREHRIEVRSEIPSSLGLAMNDADLQPILVNLLDNACDAIIAADSSAERRIEIGAEVNGDWVTVRIVDNGTGLSQDTRKRLFEPFFTTRGSEGTGLGLVLCKKLVTLYGGTIELVPNATAGTCAILRLPSAPSTK